MLKAVIKKIVDAQIKKGMLQEEERNIYLYGYQMLFEFGINIMTSILIAYIFQAYTIVFTFTISYLAVRGYVGGYHARTSLGCFCCSASILIISVIIVKGISAWEIEFGTFFLEVLMLPCIFQRTPMPDINKPITENEESYFNKKVKQIYLVELIIEIVLFVCGLDIFALSIWAVHLVLFTMVLFDFLTKRCVIRTKN